MAGKTRQVEVTDSSLTSVKGKVYKVDMPIDYLTAVLQTIPDYDADAPKGQTLSHVDGVLKWIDIA